MIKYESQTWMIADSSYKSIVEFAAVTGIAIAHDSKVVTAPIENGTFTAYNKIDLPDSVAFQAALTGDASEQEAALVKLNEFKKSTELLELITPYEFIENLNLVSVKYERTRENGTSSTMVELVLQEVRQVDVATFKRMSKPSQCKNPSAVSKTNIGRVEPQPVSPSVTGSMRAKYPSVDEIQNKFYGGD